MRKIEKQMIEAINKQRASKKAVLFGEGLTRTVDNTMICTRLRFDNKIVTTVYLHGNLIASNSGDNWGFKMCGWPTPTTKSRINAIANTFGHLGVYTKAGKHFTGTKEINAYDWF